MFDGRIKAELHSAILLLVSSNISERVDRSRKLLKNGVPLFDYLRISRSSW